MSTPLTPWIRVGAALGLCLMSFACALEPQTCDELREEVTIEELVAPGLSPAVAIEAFDEAPQPTLTWHEPAILDQGWGLSEISVDHVGECTTPLAIEVEPRGDASTWVEPEPGADACGTPGLLIPVYVRITSQDGVLDIEAEAGLVAAGPDALSFTLALDVAPASLGLRVGPPDPRRDVDLSLHVDLSEGQLTGDLRVLSHDCTPGADCTYWAEHVLATFG